ncbi:hypothetical protein CPB83DRAFT_801138 [Crepidotus variabilis]|uniref:BTB domain-containing protein n=1 Tax=Crepidotus variabilis TaxID=179855 RepID=A0A9P6E3H9_9AGAR|nr:hypothetical protein CPB83DRAFT_801138 [Crepidotus variabilis]
MAQSVGLVLTSPPPPGLQEATKNSTQAWQEHLESLFRNAKDRFPDVVWDLVGDEEEPNQNTEEVWGHKAIVYARAPPSFQTRYFSVRPHGAASPLPYAPSTTEGNYLGDSTVSLGLTPRTPSPERSSSPSTIAAATLASLTLLRLTTSINPTLFSNELEYLYTGKGFGEAFEFLFDESREQLGDDAEALRIDKLRKDLVFMWRSRLYSDVRIALTGTFSGSHENTTAIFSSHRFILVSRSSYFHDALISWTNKTSTPSQSNNEPPTLTLPSPPFTPASLHFTLGFIYTGTLIFSHRSYDLSTAFAILRAALYLALPTLHDEVQARVAQEMLHGLFHAFIPFAEYERLTAGRWGTGGCRCRQCARRAPRVIEFAIADDVKNQLLERGARRALVGLFGEGWCNSEFASLHQKIRESVLKGLSKRTTPLNAFPLLFAAEHALIKLANQIEPWADIVRDMIFTARKAIDDVLAREAEACFNGDEWMEIMENDGARFEDGERVEWAMAAVLRGVKEPFAPSLYQTLVSSILLRPHPTEVNAPLLTATSHIRIQVEQTRVELLKWIGKRWLAIRQDRGFDGLEGWAATEISDNIEVALDDLFNPTGHTKSSHNASNPARRNTSGVLLRPHSNHPHTSRVDAESEAASSMRASVLSRSAAMRGQQSSLSIRSSARDDRGHLNSSASSMRSARSTATRETVSTISATPRIRKAVNETKSTSMSPAKRLATEVRAKDKGLERPDSKLTPSIIEPDHESYVDDGQSQLDYDDEGYAESQHHDIERESIYDQDDGPEDDRSYLEDEREEGDEDVSVEGGEEEGSEKYEDTKESLASGSARSSVVSQTETPTKKILITRKSLVSLKSTNTSPNARLKASSASVKSQSTSRSSVRSPTAGGSGANPRPNSRNSTRSSRLNVSVTGSGPRARQAPRPISRLSTTSTSVSGSTNTGTSSRPTSSISSTTTDTVSTFRTASTGPGLSTPTMSRSRRPSAASSVRTTGRSSAGSSPIQERTRTISGTSVASVTSTTGSVKSTATAGARARRKVNPPLPTTPGSTSKTSPRQVQASTSGRSVASTGSKKQPVPVGTLGRKLTEKKSVESLASKASHTASSPPPPIPQPVVPPQSDVVSKADSEKENVEPAPEVEQPLPNTSSTMTIKPRPQLDLEHKKTSSSTSTSSVVTLRKRGSTDTIKTVKSGTASSNAEPARPVSKALPPPPSESSRSPLSTYSHLPPAQPNSIGDVLAGSAPRGATLDVGIPCIISSKRKRFKALARYIGEVEGEAGPWVGVEVPMPLGESWGDNDDMSKFADDRQWNDGSWGGIRYFDIGSMGSDIDYGDERPSRRRKLDGSATLGSAIFGRSDVKGSLKREGDTLSISSERMKRMRSVSPSVSEMSGTESRGLFVRPQQVLYVVDAVGADF